MSTKALLKAGITDVPCWFDDQGAVQFSDGVSAADRQRVLDAIAAYDPLPDVKAERIEANRREAQRRIAQALGMPPDTPFDKLVVKEANLLMQAVDAVASGDTATIDSLRAIKAKIDAIRDAENAAAAEIEAAATEAAISAVTIMWPA